MSSKQCEMCLEPDLDWNHSICRKCFTERMDHLNSENEESRPSSNESSPEPQEPVPELIIIGKDKFVLCKNADCKNRIKVKRGVGRHRQCSTCYRRIHRKNLVQKVRDFEKKQLAETGRVCTRCPAKTSKSWTTEGDDVYCLNCYKGILWRQSLWTGEPLRKRKRPKNPRPELAEPEPPKIWKPLAIYASPTPSPSLTLGGGSSPLSTSSNLVSPRLRALLTPDSSRSAFSPVQTARYSNPDPGYSNPDPGSSKLESIYSNPSLSLNIPPIFNVYPIFDLASIYSNPVYSNLLYSNPDYSKLMYSNPDPSYSKLLYSNLVPKSQNLPSTLCIPIPTDQLEESGDLPYSEKPESPYNPIPKFIIEENIVTLCSNNLCNIEIIGRMRHHPETAEPYCVPCFEYLKGMGEERDPKINPV